MKRALLVVINSNDGTKVVKKLKGKKHILHHTHKNFWQLVFKLKYSNITLSVNTNT